MYPNIDVHSSNSKEHRCTGAGKLRDIAAVKDYPGAHISVFGNGDLDNPQKSQNIKINMVDEISYTFLNSHRQQMVYRKT